MQEYRSPSIDNALFQDFLTAYTEAELEEKLTLNRQIREREGNVFVRQVTGIGRNSLCTCGSGKKFKHCCIAKSRTY